MTRVTKSDEQEVRNGRWRTSPRRVCWPRSSRDPQADDVGDRRTDWPEVG